MYSASVTDRAIQAASDHQIAQQRLKNEREWALQRHSRAQIDHAIAHLNDAYDHDTQQLRRALKPDELQFIANERRVCKLDYRYFADNYCNSPDAPIWMANMSFKALGDVQVGDIVMGWERPEKAGVGKQWWRHHYAPATVLATKRRRAPLVEVTFASGRVIRCTPDHLWGNGKTDRAGSYKANPKPWTVAKVGAKLRHVVDVPEALTAEQERLAAWLGGIFDGEGSANPDAMSIAQSSTHNPEVSAEISRALTALGFTYTRTAMTFRILGGLRARVRFVRLCRPVRAAKIGTVHGRQVEAKGDIVVDVRDVGIGEVVSMQTTTGNYVAHGYLSKNCFIVDWAQRHCRYRANVAQTIIRDIWAEMEEANVAIWMQQLKARRLGVSTETQIALLHRFQFYENTAAVTAAATPKNSVTLAGMLKYAFDHEPWWLKPESTKIQNDLPVEFAELHSTLSIQAGNQFTGVARGATPTVIHLSELAEWQDAEQLVDAALMRAVVDHPLIFGVMESTALGTGNWWHQAWLRHKREFAEGRARVRPVFLPWYVGTDIYPSPATLRARPIPQDWTPDDRTVNHAERAREYVKSSPLLYKYLAKGDHRWRMPRAQMWYYELEYQNAKAAKELNLFLGEMASDDFTCFQSTNLPVIDQEILLNYHERTREPKWVYAVAGPDIPEALIPSRRLWDWEQPTITVSTADLLPAAYAAKYQLIPLKFEGYDTFDPNGKLLVWELPSDDHSYGIGNDTSGGTGNDNAVMEILREATPERPPGQCAEFVHDRMTSFQMWPFMLAICGWYSTYSMKQGRRVQSRAAIECMGTGEVVQHEMQKRGWVNFHPWKRYDDKQPRADGDVRKIGIYTNAWFRPQMLDMVITCLDEEAIEIWSPYLIQELTTLEREPGIQKIKAAYGAHDDRVFGLGFPLYSLHMGKRPQQQYTRQRIGWVGPEDQAQIVHPQWRPPATTVAGAHVPAQRLISPKYGGGLQRVVNPNMPEGFR